MLDELRSEVEEESELRLAVDGDPAGTWDQDRLAQLVSNLAGNAVQHRRLRSPVELRIDGTAPERVVLEVANDGVVPAEMLPVIFEPLSPGEHRRREGSSGLGLGLYISQQIAAAHGGSIRVDSDAGRTRFTVELPRTAPAEVDQVFGAGEDEEDEEAAAE